MIDHERRLLFVHVTRTGGSSIERALVGDDWWNIDPDTKHLSAKDARAIYGEDVWETYTKFSVVRNPWDRVASMFGTKWWHEGGGMQVGCSFEDFIRGLKPHGSEKHEALLFDDILNEKLDYILRFENLSADFAAMLQDKGLEGVRLPHVKRALHKHYSLMYGPVERDLVAKAFQADIERFGYQFERVPRSVAYLRTGVSAIPAVAERLQLKAQRLKRRLRGGKK